MTPYEKQSNKWKEQDNLYIVYELKVDESTSQKGKLSLSGPKKILLENKFLNISFGSRSLYQKINNPSEENNLDESSSALLYETFKENNSGFWILIENGGKNMIGSRAYPFDEVNTIKKKERTDNCEIQNYFPEQKNCSKESVVQWKRQHAQIKSIEKQKGSRWIEAEDICEAGNKRKWDISEDQLTNLKMFCAKPKEES